MIIHATADEASGQNLSIDVSFNDIKQAYESGKILVAEYAYTGFMDDTTYAVLPLSEISRNNNTQEVTSFNFGCVVNQNTTQFILLQIGSTWSDIAVKTVTTS